MPTRVPTHRRPQAAIPRSWRCVLAVGVLLVFGTAGGVGLVLTSLQAPTADVRQGSRTTSYAAGTSSADGADGADAGAVGPVRPGGHGLSTAPRWLRVLNRLDLRRQQAWRRGSPQRLARVFAPDSRVLRRDAAHLAGYERRGLRVSGVAMQYWQVQVVGRRRGLVRLRVLDRLQAAAVRGPLDSSIRLLPTDRPSRQLITLSRAGVGWRIADIVTWTRHTRPRPDGWRSDARR